MRRGLFLLALALTGCNASSGTHWSGIAAQADEAGLWTASVTALLVVPGNIDQAQTPTLTARDAAAEATDPFSPNDCVVATSTSGTVTYTLDDCSGSFGLVHATGVLTITYTQSSDGRTQFHASATDLLLNGHDVTFEADALVLHDASAGLRTIELRLDTQGIGSAGTMFTRHGTETARWMDTWGCLFVDTAQDALTVDGVSWQAETSALSLCVGECPMSGGAITWTGTPGVMQVGYAGMNSAAWSVLGQPSQTGTLPISCGP